MHASEPPSQSPLRLLPITIVPGMTVVAIPDGTPGVVAGITQAYCIYRLADGDTLCVASWRELAIGGVCPAAPLLPQDVEENDRRNAAACVLSALLGLQQLGPLTAAQQSVLDELIAHLCGPR